METGLSLALLETRKTGFVRRGPFVLLYINKSLCLPSVLITLSVQFEYQRLQMFTTYIWTLVPFLKNEAALGYDMAI